MRSTLNASAIARSHRAYKQPVLQIKKILCPVDLFPPSDKALQYAAAMAEDYGAKVVLLHVVTPLLPVAQDYPVSAL